MLSGSVTSMFDLPELVATEPSRAEPLKGVVTGVSGSGSVTRAGVVGSSARRGAAGGSAGVADTSGPVDSTFVRAVSEETFSAGGTIFPDSAPAPGTDAGTSASIGGGGPSA